MPPSLYTGIILSATPTWINLKTALWSPRPHYCFHPHWKRSCSRADDSVCVIFVCRLFTLWHLSVLIGQYSISNENERMGSCQHLQGWCGASLQLTQLGKWPVFPMTDARIISAVSQKIVKDHVQPVRTGNSATLMTLKSNPTLRFGSTALQFCKEQGAETASQLRGTLKACHSTISSYI